MILSPRLSALLACAALALAAGACGGTDDESSNGSTSGGEAAEPATGVQAELNAACKADPADPAGTAPAEGDPNLKGTVTMWGWYNVPPEAVYKEFKKLYPNVTVKFSQFGLPETHQKLRNAVQGGTGAPDISMVEDRRGPQFWDGGLLNLDECVKPVAGAFPESKIEKVTTPAGNMQAVPWESGPVVISYRRSVFEEYGIDPESIETWDDYIAAGKQIAERSGGKVKMLISQKLPVDGTSFPGATNLFQAFTQQQGGSWYDDSTERKPTVDNPQSVAALKLLKRFRDEGIALQDPGSANAETAAVKNKQVATVFTTPASVFFLTGSVPKTEGDWGAIKMPAFEPGGTRGTNIGGTSLVITDQVKDPAAAWAWLNFWLLRVDSRLVSYEAGRLFENLYKPAAEDPFFQKPDPFYDGQEIPQLYAEVADEAPSFSEGKQLEQIERAFNTTANQFFAGEKSAEDFAKEIQAQVAAGQ